MRVLLMETDRGAAGAAEAVLQEAGHDVARCHDPYGPAFPCTGLAEPGSCPLDDPHAADVAVTWRARPHPRPAALEAGVRCALRAGVPLIVGGNPALNPFEPWADAVVGLDELADACTEALTAVDRNLSRQATVAVREQLERHGIAGAAVGQVEVTREAEGVRAMIDLPADLAGYRGVLAVRVVALLRERVPQARTINVGAT